MSLLTTTFKQIRRTPYQALIAVLVLSLTFFATSTFILILFGFASTLQYFEKAPQIIAYFEKGKELPEQDIESIKNKLEATGKLASFRYTSTKEAEKFYKEKSANEDPLLNELVDYKILPPSIEISATEITALPQLKTILDTEPAVLDIDYYEDIVNQLAVWVRNIRYLGIGVIGFLAFLSVLILMVILGLKVKNKRPEIEIMRLLGASSWQVHSPFLLEGMFYGAFGAIWGWLGSFTLLQYMTPALIEWLDGILTLPVPTQYLLMLLGVLMFVGMFLGMLGSLLAVRRFSRV